MPIKKYKKARAEKKAAEQSIKQMRPQIAQRKAYGKMQRSGALKPGEQRAAADFMATGKPKPKWK